MGAAYLESAPWFVNLEEKMSIEQHGRRIETHKLYPLLRFDFVGGVDVPPYLVVRYVL